MTVDPREHDQPRPTTSSRRRRTAVGAAAAVVLVAGAWGGAHALSAEASVPTPREQVADTPPTGDDGTAPAAGGPAAMCAAEIVFRGRTYTMTAGQPVEGIGTRIGTGSVPPCSDTPGLDQDADMISTVTVSEVENSRVRDAVHADGALWTASSRD